MNGEWAENIGKQENKLENKKHSLQERKEGFYTFLHENLTIFFKMLTSKGFRHDFLGCFSRI